MMMGGLAAIEKRGLYYFKTDFPMLQEEEHMTMFPAMFGAIPHREVFLALGVWFAVTLLYSIYNATQKRFALHRAFIYRHIAAGIWVALQRCYVLGMAVWFHGTELSPRATAIRQKEAFGDGAILGVIFTLVMAELAVWLSAPGGAVARVVTAKKMA